MRRSQRSSVHLLEGSCRYLRLLDVGQRVDHLLETSCPSTAPSQPDAAGYCAFASATGCGPAAPVSDLVTLDRISIRSEPVADRLQCALQSEGPLDPFQPPPALLAGGAALSLDRPKPIAASTPAPPSPALTIADLDGRAYAMAASAGGNESSTCGRVSSSPVRPITSGYLPDGLCRTRRGIRLRAPRCCAKTGCDDFVTKKQLAEGPPTSLLERRRSPRPHVSASTRPGAAYCGSRLTRRPWLAEFFWGLPWKPYSVSLISSRRRRVALRVPRTGKRSLEMSAQRAPDLLQRANFDLADPLA